MKPITRIIALAALVAAMTGCGGSNGSTIKPDRLKGDWSGPWVYSTKVPGDGMASLSIGDDTFDGEFTEYGYEGSGSVWGERHGDNLDGTISVGGDPGTFSVDDLKVSDGRLTGKAKVTLDGESVWIDFDLTRQDD